MGDTMVSRPDHDCLFAIASSQQGYFTTSQAAACGISRFLLSRETDTGRFHRVRRGLYRLHAYPSAPREEVMASWLTIGKDVAVVSHESAMDLLDLSDVIPNAIHLTVPRSRRHFPKLLGIKIHTTTRPFGPLDIVVRDGIRLTSPARTILDAAEAGSAPEQIEMAIQQAIARGFITPTQIANDARNRSRRVQRLVNSAMHGLQP